MITPPNSLAVLLMSFEVQKNKMSIFLKNCIIISQKSISKAGILTFTSKEYINVISLKF